MVLWGPSPEDVGTQVIGNGGTGGKGGSLGEGAAPRASENLLLAGIWALSDRP